MFTRRHRFLGALVAVGALTIAACGGDDDDGGGGDGNASGEKGTLTVWVMTGEMPEKMQEQLVTEFEASHKDVKVDVQVQEWDGIQDRTITALAGNESPDVIEFGNTFTASFASGLMDLTDKADELGKSDWHPGMAASSEVDGKLVAAPYLGAARVVIYRKDMFQQAGVTDVPTTLDDFEAAAAKLQAKFGSNPKFGAFNMPGRYFHAMLPFIWGAGGDIAVQEDGKWVGKLASDETRAGLQTLKDLSDKYSKAPKDVNELEPLAVNTLGDGTSAMVIENAFQVAGIVNNFKGKITADQLGTFPLPGANGGIAPELVGGSNAGVSAQTELPNSALDFLKLWTGEKYQKIMAEETKLLPNTVAAGKVLESDPNLKAVTEAMANTKFVPVSEKWATVEGQFILHDMLQAILSGTQSIEEATETANDKVESTLNS